MPTKTALFEKAKSWDAASVRAALNEAPALIEARDARGRTALHIACSVKPERAGLGEPNGIDTVAVLLDSGSDLESEVPMNEDEGDFRATPLWYAVARGENLPLVRYLLGRGANASFCLWAAVWRDDETLCRALLDAKPQLDLRVHGETPIFYAARLKRLKTLDVLIDAGADPTIPNDHGRTALDIARARRLPKAVVDRLASAFQ